MGNEGTKTVTMNLLCGAFSGHTKYLWLSAMSPVIEIELAAATAALNTGQSVPLSVTPTAPATTVPAADNSQRWNITNAFVCGSVVEISPIY